MRILITGATGFLGSHTAAILQQAGHQVLALVRPRHSKKSLEEMGIEVLTGDLHDLSALVEYPQPIDAVVHIAGVVKALNKQEFLHANATGTANLVREVLQLKSRPKRFVHVSSIAVHNPQEGEDFCLPPAQCHPLSDYGLSKLRGELALRPLYGKVSTLTLRPPVIYGPRDREILPMFRMIRRGFAPLYAQGYHRLSLCYVKDVATAILRMVENTEGQDGIYCVDDGSVQTWKSLSWNIAKAMQRKVRFIPISKRYFRWAAWISEKYAESKRKAVVFNRNKLLEMDQDRWVCGHQKISAELGWEPKYPLTIGLSETYESYVKAGWIA